MLSEIYETKNIMKYFTEDDNTTRGKNIRYEKIIFPTNLAGSEQI